MSYFPIPAVDDLYVQYPKSRSRRRWEGNGCWGGGDPYLDALRPSLLVNTRPSIILLLFHRRLCTSSSSHNNNGDVDRRRDSRATRPPATRDLFLHRQCAAFVTHQPMSFRAHKSHIYRAATLVIQIQQSVRCVRVPRQSV